MTPRRHIALIACLAVLFNLLAMPLSSAASQGSAEQLLWGSFCSSGAGKALVDVQKLAKIDLGQQDEEHSNMQHCWCCSGSAALLALSGQAPQLRAPPQRVIGTVGARDDYRPTPRQQWPALNPRGPPLS